MSSPLIVAVPKKQPLSHGTAARGKLDSVANVTEFSIPELKIGTYDKLVQLSDDIEKVASTVESTTARLHKQLLDSRAKTGRDAAEPVYVQGVPGNPRLEDFARSFAWADDKYPIQTPLRDMVDEIMTKVSKYADTLNQKISAYTKLSGELNGMNTRTSGNLMSRDLIPPIVDEAHFIENRGSEYMSSVFAVINKGEAKNFETQVRSVSPAICYPMTQQGTIKCLSQDDQFCLYVLWVLNDSAGGEGERPGGLSATPKSDLLKAMRENRWQFRDEVEWDPEAAEAAKKRLNELDAEKKQEEARLAKWIDAVFSEAYINYVHLKAINAFIEAVLRYGLGGDGKPEYQAYIVEAKPKMESKTRAVLADAYEALGGGKDDGDGAGALEGRREYFPYVSETVSVFRDD